MIDVKDITEMRDTLFWGFQHFRKEAYGCLIEQTLSSLDEIIKKQNGRREMSDAEDSAIRENGE